MAMRAIVLTSSLRRHAYVANALTSRLDVVCVWRDRKAFEPLKYAASDDDAAVIERHFAARDASEAAYFADHETVRADSREVPPGGCNDAGEIALMRRLAPEVVLVFGTGLLKPPLIDSFPGRIINIHLGLSPYYRGAGTNFWPLVNGEPEYCGATIHFLDAGVDTGPIIAHVRPAMSAADGPHDIGNKTIAASAAALADAAIALCVGGVRGVEQRGGGRLYKRADFSAAAVRRLYANLADGMIDTYLRCKAERDAALSLVAMETHAA
jgi:folate-dependent phosphoribosylglycinamide formyltransferase PurN